MKKPLSDRDFQGKGMLYTGIHVQTVRCCKYYVQKLSGTNSQVGDSHRLAENLGGRHFLLQMKCTGSLRGDRPPGTEICCVRGKQRLPCTVIYRRSQI